MNPGTNSDLGSPLLSMKGISKKFPGVLALSRIDLNLKKGELIGLIGENGAGKSTLARILSGIVQPDEGEISVKGKTVQIQNVRLSQSLGIALIHQELNLAPNIHAAGNVFLGREPIRHKMFAIVDRRVMFEKTEKLMRSLDCIFPLFVPIKKLTPGQKQVVEIAKVLSQSARILIMDEPTSSLSKKETVTLFSIIRDLKSRGISIIYITHRLEEVLEISDRIVCLRDGEKVGEVEAAAADKEILVRMMIGRDIDEWFPSDHLMAEESILEVKDLKLKKNQHSINFSLRKGEILGFAGLVGAGRTELMKAIFGIDAPAGGEILIEGKIKTIQSPVNAVKAGMGFVPEDRRIQGLILNMTVRENMSLPKLKFLSKYHVIHLSKEKELARNLAKKLKIRTSSLSQAVQKLSGGNQQKVVIGKWLALAPKILILDEPTRGIDVGSKAEIYKLIDQLAENRMAIILISSDLEEIIGLSDRVAVMQEGRITGFVEGEAINKENIMQLATGGKKRC